MLTNVVLLSFITAVYLIGSLVAMKLHSQEPNFLKSKYKKEKDKNSSVITKTTAAIENFLSKNKIGKTILKNYERAQMPVSVGYLVVLNIVYSFIGINLSKLLNFNVLFTLLLFFGIEASVIIYIATKSAGRKKLEKFLPSLLESVGHTYEAYPDLKNSIIETYRQNKDPFSKKFLKKINDLINIGYTPQESLTLVSKEIDNPTLSFVVSSLALQQKTGASISKFLTGTAQKLRSQIMTKKEIDQILFQNKISAIVSAALPLVFFFISASFSANYREVVFHSAQGRLMLILAGVWWSLGVVITYRSINVKS
jgi:tight adherence protein B